MKQPRISLIWNKDGVWHRHGGTPRSKPPAPPKERKRLTIAYRPDETYDIGPSRGLMRGYGKEPVPLAQRIASVIGRRGA